MKRIILVSLAILFLTSCSSTRCVTRHPDGTVSEYSRDIFIGTLTEMFEGLGGIYNVRPHCDYWNYCPPRPAK
jgi:PBP1b-binding outer membrane lipoprotein LpoB